MTFTDPTGLYYNYYDPDGQHSDWTAPDEAESLTSPSEELAHANDTGGTGVGDSGRFPNAAATGSWPKVEKDPTMQRGDDQDNRTPVGDPTNPLANTLYKVGCRTEAIARILRASGVDITAAELAGHPEFYDNDGNANDRAIFDAFGLKVQSISASNKQAVVDALAKAQANPGGQMMYASFKFTTSAGKDYTHTVNIEDPKTGKETSMIRPFIGTTPVPLTRPTATFTPRETSEGIAGSASYGLYGDARNAIHEMATLFIVTKKEP